MCHKTKDLVSPQKTTLGGDGDDGGDDDGDDDGRISSNLQPHHPRTPKDLISRSGKPLTTTIVPGFRSC